MTDGLSWALYLEKCLLSSVQHELFKMSPRKCASHLTLSYKSCEVLSVPSPSSRGIQIHIDFELNLNRNSVWMQFGLNSSYIVTRMRWIWNWTELKKSTYLVIKTTSLFPCCPSHSMLVFLVLFLLTLILECSFAFLEHHLFITTSFPARVSFSHPVILFSWWGQSPISPF